MADMVINYMDLHEIDVSPNATTPTWARLARGLSEATPSNNEDVDQTNYLDGDGYGTSAVIAAQKTISFNGHRYVGDAAQDFIDGVQYQLGENRTTTYRYTDADGSKIQAPCTVANIDIGGGGAGSKKEIAFELHLNGRPSETPRVPASELTSTVAAGSVAGTTKFTATADSGNTLAYRLRPASAGTIYDDQYIDGYIEYTSGDDIEASVGQWLQMIELDANKRVDKYAEVELTSLEIA